MDDERRVGSLQRSILIRVDQLLRQHSWSILTLKCSFKRLTDVMAAHFPGHSASSNRRRRWLTSEYPSPEFSKVNIQGSQSLHANTPEISEDNAAAAKVKRRIALIPRSPWAIVLLCALNVGLLVAVCLPSWSTAAESQAVGLIGESRTVFLPRGFCLFQFVLCAAISFLIFWHRSASRKDFMGRYRIWGWSSVFWAMAALSYGLGVNFGWVKAFLVATSLHLWRADTVAWLLPFSIGVLASYRVLRREVRQSRKSLWAWETSFAIGVITALLHLGLDNAFPARVRLPLIQASSGLFLLSVVTSLLVHLHYVVHFSRESPPRQPSRGTRVLRWGQKRILVVGEKVLTVKPPHRLEMWTKRPRLPREKPQRLAQAKSSELARSAEASKTAAISDEHETSHAKKRKFFHRIDSNGPPVKGEYAKTFRSFFRLNSKSHIHNDANVKNADPVKRWSFRNLFLRNRPKRTSEEKVQTRQNRNDKPEGVFTRDETAPSKATRRWSIKNLFTQTLQLKKKHNDPLPESKSVAGKKSDPAPLNAPHFSQKSDEKKVGQGSVNQKRQRVEDQDDCGPKVGTQPPRKGPKKELNPRVKN